MSAATLRAVGELVEPITTWSPARSKQPAFDYIDLTAVDQDLKLIVGSRRVLSSEAPSRARQCVATGDVLVSTVRPNLNSVATVPQALDGATASTGFCVLRPRPGELDHRYLFQWVRSNEFIADMVRKATGASYPAVSDRIVLESSIPLLPVAEQGRIADILDRADALRAKRRAALGLLDTLMQSIFAEMFSGAESRWPSATIGDVASSENGSIRTGPFGSQLLHGEFIHSGVAVLGIDNAVDNQFHWAGRRFISDRKYASLKRYTVKPGDVIITIMGTCGRCAIVPDDVPLAINTKHLCCITLDRSKCLPEFLHAYFLRHPSARRYLEQKAKGAIMAGLNMGIIKAMPIPLVAIRTQAEFARRVAAVDSLKAAHRASLAQLDALFASLQHRAFRGEL